LRDPKSRIKNVLFSPIKESQVVPSKTICVPRIVQTNKKAKFSKEDRAGQRKNNLASASNRSRNPVLEISPPKKESRRQDRTQARAQNTTTSPEKLGSVFEEKENVLR
jgi:hypothetical protein